MKLIMRTIILYTWQLPQHVLALIIMIFLKDIKRVGKIGSTVLYSASNMRGGISLGRYIYLSECSARSELTQRHEYGHSQDSKYWGWLYLLVIGAPSILNAILGFTSDYYVFWTEKRADRLGGISRDKDNRRVFVKR